MRVSGMAGPGEMFSFGSMYAVGSGASGFTMNGGHGAGGRRGGSAMPGGTGGAAPGSAPGSAGASTTTGGGSDSDAATINPTANAAGSAIDSADGSDLSGSLSANSGSSASSGSTSSSTPDFNALLGVGGPGGGFGAPGIFGPGAFPGFDGPGGFGGGFDIIHWAARMRAAQWARKAELDFSAVVVFPVATPTFQAATPAERKVPAPGTVNTASASAAASGKRA